MNSEQQWLTDVNSSCLHPWPFLAMQSYSLYYYYFVFSVVISLFCLDAVPPSFIVRYLYISYNFLLKKFRIVMNFGLPATPVCVLSVSVLVGYDCHTVMFQCKLEKFFLRGIDRT